MDKGFNRKARCSACQGATAFVGNHHGYRCGSSSSTGLLGSFHLACLRGTIDLSRHASRGARARRHGYQLQLWWRRRSSQGGVCFGIRCLGRWCHYLLRSYALVGSWPTMVWNCWLYHAKLYFWRGMFVFAALQRIDAYGMTSFKICLSLVDQNRIFSDITTRFPSSSSSFLYIMFVSSERESRFMRVPE